MKKPPISKRPFSLWLLALLLLFIGIGALISGPMLFLSPKGEAMQMSLDYLEGSPFPNYLVPGIILFLFIGVFPVFIGYGLLRTPGWRWPNVINPVKTSHWAWAGAWATGIIMLMWISVETVLLGYISFLQPLIGAWGAIIIILAFWPSTKQYLIRSAED